MLSDIIKQTHNQRDGRTDRHTDTDRRRDSWTDRRQKDTHTDLQTDRQGRKGWHTDRPQQEVCPCNKQYNKIDILAEVLAIVWSHRVGTGSLILEMTIATVLETTKINGWLRIAGNR